MTASRPLGKSESHQQPTQVVESYIRIGATVDDPLPYPFITANVYTHRITAAEADRDVRRRAVLRVIRPATSGRLPWRGRR